MRFIHLFIVLLLFLQSEASTVELNTKINNREVKVLLPSGLESAEVYIDGKNCSIRCKTTTELEDTGHLILTLEEPKLNMIHKLYFYNFYKTEIGSKNVLFRELFVKGELKKSFSPNLWYYER